MKLNLIVQSHAEYHPGSVAQHDENIYATVGWRLLGATIYYRDPINRDLPALDISIFSLTYWMLAFGNPSLLKQALNLAIERRTLRYNLLRQTKQ